MNNENLKPFVKGYDARRNRNGRPRSFDALRKLAIRIAGENVPESEVTRVEAMLRVMSSSRNPADRALFLAYAFGKPKEQIDITSAGEKIKGFIGWTPENWEKDEKE